MAIYTVRKGRRYRTTIKLGTLTSFASNEMVADKFRDAGFADVEVSGSGRHRLGEGLWPLEDASADIPDEVTSISEIEV